MLDDRDFSWMGRPAPEAPEFPERAIWRVEKTSRWAEARIRDLPHGCELRFVVGGEGRDEVLMQSTVYRAGDKAALSTMSTRDAPEFRRPWLDTCPLGPFLVALRGLRSRRLRFRRRAEVR